MANSPENPARRKLIRNSAGMFGLGIATYTLGPLASESRKEYQLTAGPSRVRLVPEPYNETNVWAFNDSVPGPAIRVKQNDWIRVEATNQLTQDTTIHWHGQRVPNAMDGVPHLTQTPISQDGKFIYEFQAHDAGTYWYHPHFNSTEQVGRGLYGALIVEEPEPVAVDEDLTWILDDWRLMQTAEILENFGHMHDISHDGRIGNTVTINGRIQESQKVSAGQRIRLRLINAANARIFSLHFQGHSPQIIAIDGHAVQPHSPPREVVQLAPGMRIDLILDCTGEVGAAYSVTDQHYANREFHLLDLEYDANPLREQLLDSPIQLPANPLPEPVLTNATRIDYLLAGGAMGRLRGAVMDGEWQDIQAMVKAGKAWSINDTVSTGHVMAPSADLKIGQTYIFNIVNDTAWPHPMHLHGHTFRVISRNGEGTQYQEWQDTVLINPNESAEIAFVADNPGDWMFHCHILEHQTGGMSTVVRVS